MVEEMNLEEISFELITNSGDARSFAFRALQAAKKGDFSEANDLMEQSNKSALAAHKVQTKLLTHEANGNSITLNILLIHAQDHLMTAMLAQELIEEMIALHQKIEGRDK